MAAFCVGNGRCTCWTGFGEAKMGLLTSDTDNFFFKVGSFFPGVREVMKDLRAADTSTHEHYTTNRISYVRRIQYKYT